jgi:outer membrane lipoprotein-sorting protein
MIKSEDESKESKHTIELNQKDFKIIRIKFLDTDNKFDGKTQYTMKNIKIQSGVTLLTLKKCEVKKS